MGVGFGNPIEIAHIKEGDTVVDFGCGAEIDVFLAANIVKEREKIQALSLVKECYSMKLDLITNTTVVDDAIRFVFQKSTEELNSSTN